MSTRDLSPSFKANPIAEFQDEMNKLITEFFSGIFFPSWMQSFKGDSWAAVAPALDIIENDNEFQITAELPGIEAKDVQVSCEKGSVTIKGEKKQENKEEREGYCRQERSYGSFRRVLTLPDTANLDKIEASFKNGVLKLSVQKKAGEVSRERKIEVKQAA